MYGPSRRVVCSLGLLLDAGHSLQFYFLTQGIACDIEKYSRVYPANMERDTESTLWKTRDLAVRWMPLFDFLRSTSRFRLTGRASAVARKLRVVLTRTSKRPTIA